MVEIQLVWFLGVSSCDHSSCTFRVVRNWTTTLGDVTSREQNCLGAVSVKLVEFARRFGNVISGPVGGALGAGIVYKALEVGLS